MPSPALWHSNLDPGLDGKAQLAHIVDDDAERPALVTRTRENELRLLRIRNDVPFPILAEGDGTPVAANRPLDVGAAVLKRGVTGTPR